MIAALSSITWPEVLLGCVVFVCVAAVIIVLLWWLS